MLSHEEINKPQSTKSPEETLGPCPFCGAKPKLIEIPVEVHYYVMCIECGACGSDLHYREDAIKAWNTRLSPASTAPVVDEMITVLEDIRGFYSTSNCWCDADGDSPHFEQCERAAEFYERLKLSRSHAANRPKIICLCGSTRFIEQFAITTWELEREGYIVLGCTLLPMWYCKMPSHFGEATGTKEQCDALHLRKIDLADEVLVLNIGGYIGESTRNEIAYATMIGKPVRYAESESAAATAAPQHSDASAFVRQWVSTLQDESHVTDEDAEDLIFRVIAYTNRAAAPVEPSDEAVNLLNEIDKTARQLLRPNRTPTDIDFAVEYIVSRVTALRRAVAKT